MSRSIRALRYAAAALVVSGGLIVASCGGGSVTTSPSAGSSGQSVPTTGGTLTVPAASNGQTAAFTFGTGAPGGVTLTSSSSTTAPGSAPAPSSIVRQTQAISGAVPFFFVTFTVSGSLASSFITGETVSLTSTQPATASYYIEFDDITSSPGTKLGCAGPGTVANNVATVTNGTTSGACTNSGGGGAPTLVSGHTYLAQFYYVPATNPSVQATSSASMVAAGGSLTLPAVSGYSGSVTYGALTGTTTLPVALSLANYLYAGGQTGMPTASPAPTTIYAVVNVQNTSSTAAATFGAASSMTLTVPTLVGVSSAVVRYWEWQTGSPASAMCVTTSGGTALTVTPANGVITIPSPLSPNIAACTSPPSGVEESIAPFFPMDNAIIEVTNS